MPAATATKVAAATALRSLERGTRDPAVVARALEALRPYVPRARQEREAAVLRSRSRGACLVLENLSDPHNGAGTGSCLSAPPRCGRPCSRLARMNLLAARRTCQACLRVAEGLGLHTVHIVHSYNVYGQRRRSCS